ncbi:MAG TPA: outer membrane beta-barrel protein [Elusimicrobiales bacterium]|nr:outer membrane beta-barrel protein [Elusimicrobiales bacterium]
MLKKIVMGILLALPHAPAAAMSDSFSGLSVTTGISALNFSAELDADGYDFNGLGRESFAGDIGLDYGIKLSDRFVLLAGGSIGLSSPKAFTLTSADISGSLEITDRWSIFVAPGVTLVENTLFYAKAAFAAGKTKGTDSFEFEDRKIHSGIGYGLGVRLLLGSHFHSGVEFMRNHYGKRAYQTMDISANSTAGTFYIGYKF